MSILFDKLSYEYTNAVLIRMYLYSYMDAIGL